MAEPLGLMRYRCVATPEVLKRCRTSAGAVSVHKLLTQPAVIFNRKDALQDSFLAQHFGLQQPHYPRHFAPAVGAFETAIELGMGWGMVPEQHLAQRPTLQELLPGATVGCGPVLAALGPRSPVSAAPDPGGQGRSGAASASGLRLGGWVAVFGRHRSPDSRT
jgi:DNA-binding transcriptional LysR family regulator